MDVSADVLELIFEYLPFDDVCGPRALLTGRFAPRHYFGRRCLKAVSHEWRTAARRALSRRWRPIRLLEQHGVAAVLQEWHAIVASGGDGEGSCPTILQDAWAFDRGAVMLALMTDRAYDIRVGTDGTFSLGSLSLKLVEAREGDFQNHEPGLRRIVSACEYAFGVLRSGELLYKLIYGWMDCWVSSFGWFDPIEPGDLFKTISDEFGRALETWKNPRLAGAFVAACPYGWNGDPHAWPPPHNYPVSGREVGRNLSAEWKDRAQASLFVGFLWNVELILPPRDWDESDDSGTDAGNE